MITGLSISFHILINFQKELHFWLVLFTITPVLQTMFLAAGMYNRGTRRSFLVHVDRWAAKLIAFYRLFTIGSAGFLFADLNEWWKNNRAGCAFDGEYADEFEASVGKDFGPKDTTWGSYLRKENGLNFAFSAFGSFLYLLGSIFFIPDTNMLTDGTIVFIWGSSVIFLSQAWKVYRQGLEVKYNPQVDDFCRREFKFSNYLADLPALGNILKLIVNTRF